ncbi:MAG: VOC family protein [Verrucomicrobiota bacterium]
MQILGLYTTIYSVDHLERAKAWYAEFLGQAPYFDQPFYVGFNVAGYELGLVPAAETRGSVGYWGVADIVAACADLEERGHQPFEPVTDVGGGIKVATFRDADGNVIGLIENPHFKHGNTEV